MASRLCSWVIYFGIIFRLCLGVPPVFYTSSRSSSGVEENLVGPYILFPVPPLPAVCPTPTLLPIFWVPLVSLLPLIMYLAIIHLQCQVDYYLRQCSCLLLFLVGRQFWRRFPYFVPCPVHPLLWRWELCYHRRPHCQHRG